LFLRLKYCYWLLLIGYGLEKQTIDVDEDKVITLVSSILDIFIRN
jgi:hypothetical protein